METIVIRDAVPDDYETILELNEADVEVLSPLRLETLVRLASCADMFRVAEADGRIAAFLLAMREKCGYWSDNYKWFEDHYPKFLYVDRIVVGREFRGRGLAGRLYRGVMAHAKETRVPCITAEIDIAPIYNEPSIRFHRGMGFEEVGTKLYGETITVSLQKLEMGL